MTNKGLKEVYQQCMKAKCEDLMKKLNISKYIKNLE